MDFDYEYCVRDRGFQPVRNMIGNNKTPFFIRISIRPNIYRFKACFSVSSLCKLGNLCSSTTAEKVSCYLATLQVTYTRIHVDPNTADPFLEKKIYACSCHFFWLTEITTMNSMTIAATVKQLKLVIYRFNYREVPVTTVRDALGLSLLESRRRYLDLMFLHRLLNGSIDCPDLLGMVDLRVPVGGTRSRDLFGKTHQLTSYGYHSIIPRLLRHGNSISARADFFGSSPS
ncbi:hypothetical protein J6590_046412 [Homalodisca vitripennis]|nr:hypothetical protein J6590_046412 [Homalodisca vitripennis]